MKSVFAKILLWSFGTLIVSLIAFFLISNFISERAMQNGGPGGPFAALQLEDGVHEFQAGGPRQLSGYLQHLNRLLPGEHFLTDGVGKDLVTGEDRSALISRPRSLPPLRFGRPQLVFARPSNDKRYWFIVVARPVVGIWNFVPYYLLILVAVAVLCYVLAVSMASPLKYLAQKVEQFGRGDLTARVGSKRKDEIGELSRAFDEMADRIETLLTAERRLLQDISHELRSPLARLSFAVELTRTAEDRDAAAARLRKEVTRLNGLVDALLQVTRLEGDPSSRELQDVSIDRLLQDVVGDCWIEADARHSQIKVNAGRTVVVRGDRELLYRALENVVRNAIIHAPDSTSIEVGLEVSRQLALVTVRDYGPGVPDSLLGEIFKPFFRVDSARNGTSGGVGLGLAIAQRAITLHHGRVWAKNMTPGLQVYMELPVNPTAETLPLPETA